MGRGYHPFDKEYVLFGFNWTAPCEAIALEAEASVVPFISDHLWWVGAYAGGGVQVPERELDPCRDSEDTFRYRNEDKPSNDHRPDDAFRGGAGVEAGWRFLTVDGGYLYNRTYAQPHGLRFRAGISFAIELFTGGRETYGYRCCTETNGPSSTLCECDRSPVGAAFFLYYGNELYPDDRWWDDGMVGVSFKIGVGL